MDIKELRGSERTPNSQDSDTGREALCETRDMATRGFLPLLFDLFDRAGVPRPPAALVLGPGRASGFVQVPGTRLGQNYPDRRSSRGRIAEERKRT